MRLLNSIILILNGFMVRYKVFFVNIHKNPTNTQDLNELEAEIVSKNYEEYEQYINKNK